MVIECIGLSGSGKTELLELIEKELKRREVDYVNVSANLRRGIVWKFLRVIAGALIFLSADARWLRDRLRGILQKEEPAGSFGVYENEKRVFRNLAAYSFWYRRMIRSHRIFLFDEGMLHTLMMFCADHRIADDAFRKMAAASEKGVRSARLVISCESASEEQDEFANEYERLRKAYGRDSRVLEICKEDENRKKLSRVFGRIRHILTDAEERGAR